jgi:putative flippase GtrA
MFLTKQFLMFIAVGCVNTAFSYAVYALALACGLAYPAANLLALVAGILLGFKLQGRYVFRRNEYQLFWRFLGCWILLYCFNIGFIASMLRLGLNAYWGGAIALPFVTALSFILQKYVVFSSGFTLRKLSFTRAKRTPHDS